jgi:hypothetical protein
LSILSQGRKYIGFLFANQSTDFRYRDVSGGLCGVSPRPTGRRYPWLEALSSHEENSEYHGPAEACSCEKGHPETLKPGNSRYGPWVMFAESKWPT